MPSPAPPPDPPTTWLLLPLAAGLAVVAITAPEVFVGRVVSPVAFEAAPVIAGSSGLVELGTLPGGADVEVSGIFHAAGLLQLQLSLVLWATAVGLPAWLLRQARLGRSGTPQTAMG